jgi:FixJ family two-component response regulator
VKLPDGMSGPDLATCIRKEKSDLKILFLSGYPERPKSDGHEIVDGTVLLNKPISFDELGSAVRRMLDA